MCKFYIVISNTLVGSFLHVLFLFLAVILSELHEKPGRNKDSVTEKSTLKNLCEGNHFFDCTPSLRNFLLLSVYSFLIFKWRICWMTTINVNNVVFCVMISWVISCSLILAGWYLWESDIITPWKVSKYGVFSGPYFPAFGLNWFWIRSGYDLTLIKNSY